MVNLWGSFIPRVAIQNQKTSNQINIWADIDGFNSCVPVKPSKNRIKTLSRLDDNNQNVEKTSILILKHNLYMLNIKYYIIVYYPQLNNTGNLTR